MGMLMIAIAIGYFVGFSVFLICEEKSLKNANFSDMKDMFSEELNFEECSKQFNTVTYMLVFVVFVAILAFFVGTYIIPEPLTFISIIAYMLFPSAIGSLIILLVKWRYQPFIKFVSSFLFGAGYMTGSAFGLGLLYAIKNNLF